jgi:putative tricarboxylic transport membrane protein
MELFSNLAHGFGIALSPTNLLYCMMGVTLGTFVGVLPGIGSLATIAMLLPITFHLDATAALIMLAGIYYGAMCGGSTTSILVNLPGTAAHAVTCIDGYPMAKQGRAAAALVITTIASVFAGIVATMVIAMAAPSLARVALNFGAPEYFSLMVLALLAAAVISQGAIVKSLAMAAFGLLLGMSGTDLESGVPRYTFGHPELWDGINFIVIAMGLFGFAEVISNLERHAGRDVFKVVVGWRQMIPKREDLAQGWKAILRGTVVGATLGPLPAAGAALSSFMAYSIEKRSAKDPSRFGKGAIEGVAAPEAANNAAAQTGFIPTLTLGIPGDSVGALVLGALMIHGIAPGPTVMTRYADLFWGLVASMFIGNMMLLVLNLPMIGIWVRMLTIPYRLLYPAVLFFISVGVYSVNNSVFDVLLSAGFGLLGYIFIKLGCEPAPLLLGFILGPMMEENFRRAMLMSRGNPFVFLTRPLSLAFLVLAVLLAVFLTVSSMRARRQQQEMAGG